MKGDRAFLLHIRDSAVRILAYTAEGPVRFLADPRTQDAVVRNLEVIVEARAYSGRIWAGIPM